jgi:hypothetical protein
MLRRAPKATRKIIVRYQRYKKLILGISGFVVGLAVFLHSFDEISTFILKLAGKADANLKLIDQHAQMATDSTFAQIFVETRAAFAELPASKRYYRVTFFMTKSPGIGLKGCSVVVDGDEMNPLVSDGDIGDVSSEDISHPAMFRLRSVDNDPPSRTMYVKCRNAVSEAVTISLQ